MTVVTKNFQILTKGYTDIVNITKHVSSIVASSNIKDGAVLVFIGGSTAGITTLEFEPGLLEDLPDAFERIAPSHINYKHDETWGDGNGMAHVRSALVGCSKMVPIVNGALMLGTWQQIVLIDFDNRPRNRNVVVQLHY
ncbi:MAG: secondary thiamine-phosphate synthase enzyme YjbQ [Cyanobacteriota bacterium]